MNGLKRGGRTIEPSAPWIGLVDQGVSSLSNFLVTTIAFFSLETAAFGAFAIGLAWYAIVIGITRSVVSEPQAIRFAGSDVTDLDGVVRQSTGTAAVIGLASGATLVLAGVVLDGVLGDALVALGAVLPLLVLQDSYRLGFIIAGRPRKALVSDGVWLLGSSRSPWLRGRPLWVLRGWSSCGVSLAGWQLWSPPSSLVWLRDPGRFDPGFGRNARLRIASQPTSSSSVVPTSWP